MNREHVWVATVPNMEGEPSPEYRALERAGEILHVHEDPEVTRVLTRTMGAAQMVVIMAAGDEGVCVTSVQPAVICTVRRGADGHAAPGDLEEMQRLADQEQLYTLGPDSAFTYVTLPGRH